MWGKDRVFKGKNIVIGCIVLNGKFWKIICNKLRSLVNIKDYGDVWNKYKYVWKGNK